DDLPTRRLRRFDYHCACRTHQLSSTRHYRALAGQTYYCIACRDLLRPGPMAQAATDPAPHPVPTRPAGRK
ncbi:MAG TPA: hypothetical protein VLM84_13975, partial [Chromatiaceae bacterium]|nr:hypothetical protein [Chromatiaceae bacterium]